MYLCQGHHINRTTAIDKSTEWMIDIPPSEAASGTAPPLLPLVAQPSHLSSSGSSQVDNRHLEAPGTCVKISLGLERFHPCENTQCTSAKQPLIHCLRNFHIRNGEVDVVEGWAKSFPSGSVASCRGSDVEVPGSSSFHGRCSLSQPFLVYIVKRYER